MAFWVTKGSPQLKLDKQPVGVQCAIIFGVAGAVTLFAAFVMVPFMYRRAKREEQVEATKAEEGMFSPPPPLPIPLYLSLSVRLSSSASLRSSPSSPPSSLSLSCTPCQARGAGRG